MNDSKRHSGAPWRNLYGRRHGKSLKPRQKAALCEDLPKLKVSGVGWTENPGRNQIDLVRLFGERPIWLEIGFGGWRTSRVPSQMPT